MASLRHYRFRKQPYQLLHAAGSKLIAFKDTKALISQPPYDKVNDLASRNIDHHIDFKQVSTLDDTLVYVDKTDHKLCVQDLNTFTNEAICRATDKQIILPTLFKETPNVKSSILWIEGSTEPKAKPRLLKKIPTQESFQCQALLPANKDFHELSVNQTTINSQWIAVISSEKNGVFWHENQLFILDLKRPGKIYEIPAQNNGCFFAHPTWLDDQRLLYIAHNGQTEGLYVYDIKTQNIDCLFQCAEDQQISRLSPKFSATPLVFAKKRHSVLFVVTDSGQDKLYELSLDTNKARFLSQSLDGTLTRINQICLLSSEDDIALTGSSKDLPESLFVLRILSSELCRLDSVTAAKSNHAHLITYGHKDGFSAPCVLHIPSKKRKYPLLVLVHSGPFECSGFGWAEKASYFNQLGYAVAYINYAGSSGYGFKHAKSIYGKWGQLDCRHIEACIKQFKQLEFIDLMKVVVWGGDLGASTIINTIAEHHNLVSAAICVYPILDLRHYVESGDKFRANYIEHLVCNSKDKNDIQNALQQASPKNAVDRIITPMLLFYGDQDNIVPKSHYESFISSALRKTSQCQGICLKGEGHQWKNESSYRTYYLEVERFLKTIVATVPNPHSK